MRRDRPALFRGRHFEAEIIILCVRRYLRYALSLRNLEEIMAERKLQLDHFTIWARDSALRAGTQSALSAGTAQDKRVLACRRNLSCAEQRIAQEG
jgi:hypothetical protein